MFILFKNLSSIKKSGQRYNKKKHAVHFFLSPIMVNEPPWFTQNNHPFAWFT